jgi:hypothetical protein
VAKGPERGPLNPLDPFARVLEFCEHPQRADMAAYAPVRFGQHALKLRPTHPAAEKPSAFCFAVESSLWLEIGAQRRHYNNQIRALPSHPPRR